MCRLKDMAKLLCAAYEQFGLAGRKISLSVMHGVIANLDEFIAIVDQRLRNPFPAARSVVANI